MSALGNGGPEVVHTPKTSALGTALIVGALVVLGGVAIGIAYRYSPCQEDRRRHAEFLRLGAPKTAEDIRERAQDRGCAWAARGAA